MIKSAKYKAENDALKIKLPIRNPLKEYECWYFESILDNGDQIRVSCRINETYSLPIIYGIQIELVNNGNITLLSESFTSNQVEFSTEKCNHRLGNNWFLDFDDHIRIHSEIKGVVIDLLFYPSIQGFNNQGDGIVNRNISGTEFFGWNIPIPKAKVQGFILKNEIKTEVKGNGYHDHIWSNAFLDNNIKQLVLGRIYDNELSIYYTLILENEKSIFSQVIVSDNEGIILKKDGSPFKNDLKVNLTDYSENIDLGTHFPKKILIHGIGEMVDAKLKIELNDTFSNIEKHRLRGKNVLRFNGNESYDFKIKGNRFSGNTKSLHEIVIF